MIKRLQPLSIAQVKDMIKSMDKKELNDYLKKFSKLQKADAEKLSAELKDLKNVKIKDEYNIKIIDFLPKTSEELNKIFIEISLDEKEINEILSIVGRY
jgi:DNA-directed RNA polymerase subunit F